MGDIKEYLMTGIIYKFYSINVTTKTGLAFARLYSCIKIYFQSKTDSEAWKFGLERLGEALSSRHVRYYCFRAEKMKGERI